ncbi:pyridoxal-phosphate dependent enzyme [Sporolactobacillus shoreicorticis]|uniref:Threonine/serine dehydratase n=1 Tax=Sporolactobacillus shoreicorticis TaxID=1923877 RepID=A0ABW5S3J6_9BACL|nr:threonine/serine dehydratase [Sporolactobacillus shoreicorticis]MCO7124414.1 pyridoxal-phosphate dependent enzyme [Sporolactobacillus shoreicorticis]
MKTIGDYVSAADIAEARETLTPVVHRTPMLESATLNRISGAHLHLKLENMQRTGSFKLRGAFNKMAHLSVRELKCSIVTASAGNHAQGIAYAASKRGAMAKIFMPERTPQAKIQATAAYGAEVVLAGASYEEAYEAARAECQAHQSVFVHAFDDNQVIAGQGTVAAEMLAQCSDLDTVLVPIGGGGLAAGTVCYLKNVKPSIRVIGVQSDHAPAAYNLFHHDKKQANRQSPGIAEGILVDQPGERTVPVLRHYLDDLVTVTDSQIAQAMLLMLERGKLLVEGAGAASLAAALSGSVSVKGKHVGLIVSGGNADAEELAVIKQMALGENRNACNL